MHMLAMATMPYRLIIPTAEHSKEPGMSLDRRTRSDSILLTTSASATKLITPKLIYTAIRGHAETTHHTHSPQPC